MPQDGTRRSGRIPKQIAITLVGSDIEGRVFSERTKTVVLSRHGAGIISEYKLSAEQELVIRSEESHKEIDARVVGQIGSDAKTYIYGIAFLDREINFWGLDFPDLSDTEKEASLTLLECASCYSREMADHSDLASDVMAVNESIVRYCRKCGSSTLWKKASDNPAASEVRERPATPGLSRTVGSPAAPTKAWRPPDLSGWPERPSASREQSSGAMEDAWAPSGTTPPVPSEPARLQRATQQDSEETAKAPASAKVAGIATKDRENRRKHARARVTFKACVRSQGIVDDVVVCEDMSRGGFRFKSRRQYFEKTLIEVAVPYSPGSQAIFVPAQIAYVQELPEEKMFRCGAVYLRGRK